MRRAIAILLSAAFGAVACAQDGAPSPEDRIAALESQLAEVRAERDALRVRLGEAIEMLRNLGYAPPAPVLAEPSDPLASPLAAMQTLRRRARLELAPMPRRTAEDRAAYRRAAREWVDSMNNALAGERDWLVRVLAVDLPASGSSVARANARLQLFDAATGARLSAPMDVPVPGRVGRRMAASLDQGDAGWTARVRLRPAVRHNPDRVERGPFDHPPFMAPEVEAEVGVDWLRFEPASVPEGFFPERAEDDPLALPGESPRAVPAESPDDAPARQPR